MKKLNSSGEKKSTEPHLLTDSPNSKNRITQSAPILTLPKSSPIPILNNQSKQAEKRLFSFTITTKNTPEQFENKTTAGSPSSTRSYHLTHSLPIIKENEIFLPRKNIGDIIFEHNCIVSRNKKSSSDSKEDSFPTYEGNTSSEEADSYEYLSQGFSGDDSSHVNEDEKDN